MLSDEPFYMPDPALFADPDAYEFLTGYAAALEGSGLRDQFPADPDVRKIAIELLAKRYSVNVLEANPSLIADVVSEAKRRS